MGGVFAAGAGFAGLFADFHCFVSFVSGFFGGNCHGHNRYSSDDGEDCF